MRTGRRTDRRTGPRTRPQGESPTPATEPLGPPRFGAPPLPPLQGQPGPQFFPPVPPPDFRPAARTATDPSAAPSAWSGAGPAPRMDRATEWALEDRERSRARRRRNRTRSIIGLGAFAALVAGSLGATAWLAQEAVVTVEGDALIYSSIGSVEHPPAPEAGTVSATPLGTPPAIQPTSSPYDYMDLQPDGVSPITWDPCRPIHFVVDHGAEPPEADRYLEEAVAGVSAATGLQFIDDGPTDEGPDLERAPYQPDRYGERWAPVLITWSDARSVPQLGGDVLGLAGPQWVADGTGYVNVTGVVALDVGDIFSLVGPDGSGDDLRRSVIEHELGHLVGLAHVGDSTQLMAPYLSGDVTTFQAGDRAGLAALGAGTCHPDI